MLASMTGFGRKERRFDNMVLSCEMRSVNHRFFELSVRLPEELRGLEPAIRERTGKRIKRGKLEVSLRLKADDQAGGSLVLNEQLAGNLVSVVESLSTMLRNPSPVDPVAVLGWPGVVSAASADPDMLGKEVFALLEQTLDDLVASRRREGEKTHVLLSDRLQTIEQLVAHARKLRPAVVERQKEKLEAKLAELSVAADPARLEQELVYAAQRLDVDEELDRLGAHVSEMQSVLVRDEPVGRRLDFLLQEFNREANTLGSKSSDVDTTGCSVELKVVIEQMREQIQNIE